MRKLSGRYNCLFEPLKGLESFCSLADGVKMPGVRMLYGPDASQRAHVIAALVHKTQRPALVVVSNELAAQRMTEDLNLLLDNGARNLPARDISFLKTAASSRELSIRRIEALGDCVSGKAAALVVSADCMQHRLMPPERFAEYVIKIDETMRMEPSELIEKLVGAGYERVQMVEGRGQCALRGGILDVYPVGEVNALRIEFFDDEIDSIRSFDVMTQRSISKRTCAVLYPAAEILLRAEDGIAAARALRHQLQLGAEDRKAVRQKKIEEQFNLQPFDEFMKQTEDEEESAQARAMPSRPLTRNYAAVLEALETGRYFDAADSLLPVLLNYAALPQDYLENPFIVLDQPERLRERCENRGLEFREQFRAAMEREEALPIQAELLIPYDQVLSRIRGGSVLITSMMLRSENDFKMDQLVKIESLNAMAYASNVRELATDVKKWISDGWKIVLMAGGKARGERLEKALREQEVFAPFEEEIPQTVEGGKPVILPFTLGHGFLYPDIRFAMIAESDIFGVNRQKSRTRTPSGEKISAFTDLRVGDYVVHENYGIGQYMGTVRLASEGTYRDFLHISYQGADKLYVPTDQLDRVQKYIGSEGNAPRLNRLSGGEWQKQKSKVKQSIQEIAGDLLKLYAQREAAPGHAFEPDTPWQREFEDEFPYEETPDQLTAIEDIKRDMESNRAMDRLLCGDVGYGKTEVALRAIFKAVMGGKQAAMLAPTTILVQQHFNTMRTRFGHFPVRIEMISRFKTAAEQKQILKKLETGEVDVVVGTHRLLAKDVKFKNLGLLVVDEEQRFGVTHKEAIKKMKQSVDVLTLTATPIPRTLHMSMVGIRDMSLLQSPPEERYPVQTYVVEYSDGLVRDAILRELARGGQVYVLHNRVQSIDVMYNRLKKLVPEAKIAVGHGQMREHALEDVMMDFYEGKFDVLLCTTIIEAGLDVPRANTLIVCDADRFGLAQLYQLRGRVGRSNRLAYAYLTVNPNKVLTETADRRLSAIREFTEFGSGFRIAMRDLEIRGAGNLLGNEQSGFMASVGYDLYVKMIEETVREMRGDTSKGNIDTRVDVKVDAYLPKEYVSDDLMRLEMYKKIASIQSEEGSEDLVDELIDRFGDLSQPVLNLITLSNLRSTCSSLAIDHVSQKENALLLRFSISADIDLVRVLMAVRNHPEIQVLGGNPPILRLSGKTASTEALLQEAVSVMREVQKEFLELGKTPQEATEENT